MNHYLRTSLFLLVVAVSIHSASASAFVWIPKEVASADSTDLNAHEGAAVAMSGDILVVGAPNLDRPAGDFGVPPAMPDAGGVRIYRRYTGSWRLDQYIHSPQEATGSDFGAAVAIAGDVLVVGEPGYTPSSIPNAVHNGRALVYVRSPATGKFVFRREIFRLGFATQYDYPAYGTSVDVALGSGHEYAVAVGAPGEDGIDAGSPGNFISPDMGAVLVARLHTTTNGDIEEPGSLETWFILNRTLKGEVEDTSYRAFAYKALFGKRVALARAHCQLNDCDNHFWLAVGAPNADVEVGEGNVNTTITKHGAAQFFGIESFVNQATSSSDVWRQNQYLFFDADDSLYLPFFINSLGKDNKTDQQLGSAVDLRVLDPESSDWRNVEMIIGAERAASADGSARTGAAYYYRIHPNDCCMRGVQSLYAEGAVAQEQYGKRVAFVSNRLLIAAPNRDSGSVFVYEKAGADTWANTHELLSPSPATQLIGGIAGSDEWIAAGAPVASGETATWQRGWHLHVEAPEDGKIQVLPPIYGLSPAVVCPPDCSLTFENGRHLHPTAIAEDGYVFQHWEAPGTSCDGDTSQTCSMVVDADRDLAASFAFNVGNTRNVNMDITGGSGTIRLTADNGTEIVCPDECGGIFANGTFVSLIAIPDAGFEFAGWTGPCASNGGNTCSFQLNTSTQLTAAFRAIDGNRMVTVNFEGSGPGMVGISHLEGFLSCDADSVTCSLSRPADETVALGACTMSGGRFLHWGGACSSNDDICVLQLDTHKEVTATFEATDSIFVSGFDSEKFCPAGWFRPVE